MIGVLFGGNLGITVGTFFMLFLMGLILGMLFKGILKTILIIVIVLMFCSFLGVVAVNWPLVVGTIGTGMLILISLLLTALPFTVGFIIGMVLSIKKRKRMRNNYG